MGTNFYLKKVKDKIGLSKEVYHIGKDSYGWVFTFRKYLTPFGNLDSWKSWKELLKQKTQEGWVIVDEYDEPVSFYDFCAIVEHSKNDAIGTKYNTNELSEDGYPFLDVDFC